MIIEAFFYVSFLGILGMLSFKAVEEKIGGVHWWSRFIDFADTKIHEQIQYGVQKYKLWQRIASLFLFEFLPAYAYQKTIQLKDYLYKKYYTSQSNLIGNKRMLRGNGSVSDFLQHITKEEEKVEKKEDGTKIE